MPSIAHILRLRRRRRDGRSRSFSYRGGQIGVGCSAFLGFAFALSLFVLAIIYAWVARDLPNPEALTNLLEPPDGLLLNPTRLYDRSGDHLILSLEDSSTSESNYLFINKNSSRPIPEVLVEATVAIAEPQFWNGLGFSLGGILQGTHPTIAQMLSDQLLLWDEPEGLRRSLRERMLAAQITASFGRDRVLEWYLNSADYGHLAYGADEAARLYLGKSATKLSLAEAALLAAVSDAPALNPIDAPASALERQRDVLDAMLRRGVISADEFQAAIKERLNLRKSISPLDDASPAYTNLVIEDLSQIFSRERILRGGLKIRTTLDFDLQEQTLCTREAQIARLVAETGTVQANPGSEACQAARLLPTLSLAKPLSDSGMQANVVVLDPATGEILAMVGSVQSGSDPAHTPGKPPGSAFSPFTYLTGFSRGFTPASLVWDIPSGLPEDALGELASSGDFGGPMRLRSAMANDRLIPAARLFLQMGPANVLRTAQQLGLQSLALPEGRPAYDLLLDGGEVTLLELSQAFGVFANQGVLTGRNAVFLDQNNAVIKPKTVLNVTNDWGETLLDCHELQLNCQTQAQPVISAQLAYLITDVLSDEAARWPSLGHPNPLEIGRPAGAKIGQVAGDKMAWTIGYTPDYVVGVWMGLEDASTSELFSPQWAAGLWHAVIQYASQAEPAVDWTIPAGISTVVVCDPSGMLPTSECPALVNEVFPSGSEPTQTDTLFRTFQVNRETGRLATIFTPPELIDERTYMVVPPEAADWAQQAGLPTPPETYDVLFAQESASDDVQISSPEMFSKIKGEVTIQGRARGDDFAYYRVQIGKGLNPSSWLQVGADVRNPVSEGPLAVWDTSELSGLYALQLLVVDQNQNVKTTTVQVTVDNRAPEINIRFPEERQRFDATLEFGLTFQVDASDDLGLDAVTFFVDGRRLVSLDTPPYAFSWEASPGEHTLRVQAIDEAGNTSEVERSFSVQSN